MPPRTGSRDPRTRRTVATLVALFYVALFVALIWPVYPLFSGIEPRILEMPFSLVYVVGSLILSFAVLFAYHLWEGADDDPVDGDG
jgi:hypothetical protein